MKPIPFDDDDDGEDDSEEKKQVHTFPHMTYKFLETKHIMDKFKRRPDHPDYDPTTLYVPDTFMKTLTPAMRQWWLIKVDHFDTVLFFKMGKFYELFHMDAVLSVELCGLIYMKQKEIAHAGFPEMAFET